MDGLCLRKCPALPGIGPSIAVAGGTLDFRSNVTQLGRSHPPGVAASSAAGAGAGAGAISLEKSGEGKTASSRLSFRYPFRSLLPWVNNNGKQGGTTMKGVAVDGVVLAETTTKDKRDGNNDDGGGAAGGGEKQADSDEGGVVNSDDSKGRGDGNWVFKILHVKSLWSDDKGKEDDGVDKVEKWDLDDRRLGSSSSSSSPSSSQPDEHGGDGDEEEEEEGFCDACQIDDDNNRIIFNRDSFSKLLKKVPLYEAKLYAQLSYLGNLAYDIPNIKPRNLLRRHRLQYVTSSVEKREQIANADTMYETAVEEQEKSPTVEKKEEIDEQKKESPAISASAAFKIAASAASYLNTRTRCIIFRSSVDENGHQDRLDKVGCGEEDREDGDRVTESDMASLMATTDSVTAVVSAKEEVKQAVADDLNSISSAPCEWYICDDEQSSTRFFVIQGSETLASWQANLLFEPVHFEELGVFVHRGIYEAAKGMYQQMLPEITAHMKAHGRDAKFRFTGHSLGGSLSLLINLMLLIRGEVPLSSLLPVLTFGSPSVMCGGDELLRKLGLPRSHIQAITMHRDIVPRAFSCSYPGHVAELLKAISGNFRNHPCLNKQQHKLLYGPMGELIILQPESSFSPQHELLPSGSGLYLLTCSLPDADERDAERELIQAKNIFLNSPHPLEILSDRSAYGSGGTIQRDHDMNSYLKCVRSVIRQELNQIRKAKRERRRKLWWPIVSPRVVGGIIVGWPRSNLPGLMKNGGESLKRFSRLVASQHMHLLVVLLFPARLLLIGAFSAMGFR